MLKRYLFSPGKSLLVRASSKNPISQRLPPPSPDASSHLPASVQQSLLFPELETFDRILRQIEENRGADFEIFQGPFRLSQKILTRSLLSSAPHESESELDIKKIQEYLTGPFHSDFEKILDAQGFHAGSEVSLFIENLRERFQALGTRQYSNEHVSQKKLVFFQMLMNIGIFSVLFYTTYFWKDWEVVEPISYLIVVGFNLIYFVSALYYRKVSGSQRDFFVSNITSKLMKQRINFSSNRKQFESFYFEYQEILRRIN